MDGQLYDKAFLSHRKGSRPHSTTKSPLKARIDENYT